MGHFSMEKSVPAGSTLSGNQQGVSLSGPIWADPSTQGKRTEYALASGSHDAGYMDHRSERKSDAPVADRDYGRPLPCNRWILGVSGRTIGSANVSGTSTGHLA